MRRFSYLVIALGLAASGCGTDKKSEGKPNTNPNDSTAGNTNNTVTTPPGNNTNPTDTGKTYTGPTVVMQGRMVPVAASPGQYLFNWAGTSFTCRPAAASVAIGIKVPDATATSSQWLDVYIDGVAKDPVKLAAAMTSYSITLPDVQPHIVTWVLRTEANYGTGVMTFTGITATGGTLQNTETPQASPRAIEFIGDSITNGYGARSALHDPVLNRDSSCTVTGTGPYVQDSSTESATLSYATLTAQHFGAQYSLVASSGRGVYRNGQSTSDPNGLNTPNMSALYPYALHPYSGNVDPANPNKLLASATFPVWNPNGWAPQVVVINLGTNDFQKHGSDPGNANNELYPVSASAYTAAYAALLQQVHTNYPGAKVIPMVGPMLSTQNVGLIKPAITAAAQQVDQAGAWVMPIADVGVQATGVNDTGCEYHPLPATHASAMSSLVAAITTAVGWM